MRQKFGKKNRLGKDTSTVVTKGKRTKFNSTVVFYRPDSCPRLSIIISKKVGNSVTRNKLKRWTREIFRIEKDNLKNFGIAVNYKPGAANYSYKKAKKILLKLWKKNKILKN